VLDGAYGQPYTSDYVLDEVVTLTRARTESFEAANTVANRILGEDPFPRVFELLYIHPDDVHASQKRFVSTMTTISVSPTRRSSHCVRHVVSMQC